MDFGGANFDAAACREMAVFPVRNALGKQAGSAPLARDHDHSVKRARQGSR
jgi:hypothetical protein